MNNWVHKGFLTITQAITQQFSERELLYPVPSFPDDIPNLPAAAQMIRKNIKAGRPIVIVGDYDADGTCAAAILFLTFRQLGANVTVRIPHRMTEGYGISVSIIDEILAAQNKGLIVTVDNGITAFDAMEHAKKNGFDVVVIDHHLPADTLPEADVIVNPKVDCGMGFEDYCGAGLAYKLAAYMLPDENSRHLLSQLAALSAIGTVADVVPLHGDNRIIVRKGLEAINSHQVFGGLQSVLDACQLSNIHAVDIGFKLAPVINAPGRLIDDGARLSCAVLASEKAVPQNARKLCAYNEERKGLVQQAMNRISTACLAQENGCLVVFDASVSEGIAGIIAGRLTEMYGLPALVFAKGENGWKGSGRSVDRVNLKERLDKTYEKFCRETGTIDVFHFGGHAGAAGMRLEFGFEKQFRTVVAAVMNDIPSSAGAIPEYDVCVAEENLRSAYEEQAKFEPFGEGCPQPTVLVPGLDISGLVKMGNQKQHIRFQSPSGIKFLGFNMANQFDSLKNCSIVDVLGKLSYSETKWGKEIQFIVSEVSPGEKTR